MTQNEKEKIIDEIIDNSFCSDIFNDKTDVEIIKLDTVLDIIKKQPTINQTKISPNLTNKGFIKKAFPNIDLDLNQKHNGYFLGYRDKTELRPIVWFDENWLKEKYNGQYQDVKTKKCK